MHRTRTKSAPATHCGFAYDVGQPLSHDGEEEQEGQSTLRQTCDPALRFRADLIAGNAYDV